MCDVEEELRQWVADQELIEFIAGVRSYQDVSTASWLSLGVVAEALVSTEEPTSSPSIQLKGGDQSHPSHSAGARQEPPSCTIVEETPQPNRSLSLTRKCQCPCRCQVVIPVSAERRCWPCRIQCTTRSEP